MVYIVAPVIKRQLRIAAEANARFSSDGRILNEFKPLRPAC